MAPGMTRAASCPYAVLPRATGGYSTLVHEPASGSKYAVATFIAVQGLEERGRVHYTDNE